MLSQNVYVLSYFTFGKSRRSLSSKHEIRWFLISGTSNRASMGDFPSSIRNGKCAAVEAVFLFLNRLK